MLLLGIDLGTSSIKVAVTDALTHRVLATAQYPDTEAVIVSKRPGWAEQSPDLWWEYVQEAIRRAHALGDYDPMDIGAIGIAYQMHGLVLVDKEQRVLRDSIIWCDSRAVPYGDRAFAAIGEQRSLERLLNSPGNFTAAKLAWVKENEPFVYEQIDKVLLPGDFIALRLTGEATTTISALSEGIFWDFASDTLSDDVFRYFGFDKGVVPSVRPVFGAHGGVTADVAAALGLKKGIPVSYKAGDQPNNALSLNVLEPGEVAATAGTSGVIYGVSDALTYDPGSRVNSFAHVNYTAASSEARGVRVSEVGVSEARRVGVLLCINGTGILNRWVRDITGGDYEALNAVASAVEPGSAGLKVLPFGNGAERIFYNKIVGAQVLDVDLNVHSEAHLYRAGQEGIAFAFRYGLDIMRGSGMNPGIIRAGNANMFKSPVFVEAFVNTTNVPVELYNSDGSIGAAIGAGMGAGIYRDGREAFAGLKPVKLIEPARAAVYDELYGEWKEHLSLFI
ncbi:xylulokinase [Puia dinghuensis]|uniref:Carbohydrate kinase n=1 Tax=Puia dinghuensis TaxID=1792502 RepID=A0A8J2XVC4_9BACT|nr:FGGY family carbohydrate kinase [Puia dinghuensis]GGB15638.1 carbohydrate kinase [Puia dinghuensis]